MQTPMILDPTYYAKKLRGEYDHQWRENLWNLIYLLILLYLKLLHSLISIERIYKIMLFLQFFNKEKSKYVNFVKIIR